VGQRDQNFGKAVANGAVRYFSPSSLSIADPEQYGGCLRRWFYKYVLGRKEPQTAAQEKGERMHDEIETYLLTGEKVLGTLAMSGARFIPEPAGRSLDVEFSMVKTMRDPDSGIDIITHSPLTAAGIPVVGYGDLLERGSPDYLDEEGERRSYPAGVVCEATDWKSTSNLDFAKPGPSLKQTVQMVSYGEWAARTNLTPVDWLRLSHVYFRTTGKPAAIKRSVLVPRHEIAQRWEAVERVACSAIEAAKETDPRNVAANPSACSAWKGCPHREVCPVAQEASLETLFGKGMSMSVLGKLNLPGSTPAPQAPTASLSMTDAVAALKAKEAAALAAKASTPVTPPPKPPLPAGFAEAVLTIQRSNMGTPAMNAIVAQAWAQATGGTIAENAGIEGAGVLGQLTLIDPAQVLQLAQELAPPAAAPASGLLPPDAPASDPALAAKPIEGVSPPSAPAPMSAPSGQAPQADAPAEKPKAKRAAKTSPPTGPNTDQKAEGEPLIYVNAVPRGSFEDLAPYVAALSKVIADHFNPRVQGDLTTGDIRIAPGKDSPIAFGQWKGALTALARESPPAPGVYMLLTGGDESPAAIVADALFEFVAARGVR
jgi:hypothetical protein